MDFDNEVLNLAISENKLVVIDFWAEWCGPCRTISPIISELSETYKESAVIGKLNVDNNEDLAAKYEIRSIPTVLFLKDGKVLDSLVGSRPKSDFVEKIESNI
tara:strand:+ start:6727 stop:7035 length:309 start_codon:yes stop_codon:yes gene_type:complete